MKYFPKLPFYLIPLLILSCPRPQLKIAPVPELDYLKEAERTYQHNPVYAYNLLLNVSNPNYLPARAEMLVKIYLDQREYERARLLLDRLNWSIELPEDEKNMILLKTQQWQRLGELTTDPLLKGIACYKLGEYVKALEYLSAPSLPADYRLLYLVKSYKNLGDYENFFRTLAAIDTISPYLLADYQNLLYELLLNIKNPNVVHLEMVKLKNPALQEYLALKIAELKGNRKQVVETAWKLIKKFPKSPGALYSLAVVKPKVKSEYKLFGKAYYYHNDFKNALKYFEKSGADAEVNYFLGKIYYERSEYSKALKYFSGSKSAEGYYYRARIYEAVNNLSAAVSMYDSLYLLYKNSSYAIRGLKRKGFLLEDMGDTLKAVATFLKVKEKNTTFRAAMHLFSMGQLSAALQSLQKHSDPDFIYWQIRIKERLGESAESLKKILNEQHPLSYYSLVKSNYPLVFDTTPLAEWVRQLGDTTVSIDKDDSRQIEKAIRYFKLNEPGYAFAELEMIKEKSPQDLVYLTKLCAQYGADRASISYALKLKKIAEQKGLKKFPAEFYRLLYPLRYIFSILEDNNDLSLALALIWQESHFDPKATSPANAQGLMQIIPATGRAIAQELGISSYSLYDPRTSIKFGSYYFAKRLADFNSLPLALASYNAGPATVKRWLAKKPNIELDEFIELIPFTETRDYVKSILARQIIYKKLLDKITGRDLQSRHIRRISPEPPN